MKYMLESIYCPGYFDKMTGLRRDIQIIKFILFETSSQSFKDLFNDYFYVLGTY